MFDLELCVREAISMCDGRLETHPAWAKVRAELTSPDTAPARKKRLLALAGSAAGRAFIGPQMVLLDITGRCNATCLFCRDHSPRAEGREPWRSMEMDADLVFRLIGEAEELGCGKMPILAAGEPTLHSRFPEIVARLAASPMTFEVFTNGIILKDADLDLLSEAKNGIVYFSVSAASNETFLAQRPGLKGDLLAKVEDNIRALAAARDGRRPRIIIVNVVNAGNFREVIPMMEKAVALGVDEVQYKLTEISPVSFDMKLSPEQLRCLDLEMRHAKNLAGAAGLDVQDNLDVQLEWVNPETGRYAEGLFDRIPCRVGYEFARVRRDGRVSFCCGLKFFGNLNEISLGDHWRSPEMDQARRAAFDFPGGADVRLPDGGRLRDEQCDSCYNYILNIHAEREWRRLSGDGGGDL